MQASGGFTAGIGKINAAWDTGTITWDKVNSGSSFSYGTSAVPADIERWKTFDVTQVVKALVSNQSANFGFVLNQAGGNAEGFYSSFVADIALRPRLEITYDDGVDRVASPVFSEINPQFTATKSIAITSATPGAVIRYTLDGTEPVETSAQYSSPLQLNATAQIRAKGFLSGKTASVTTGNYCEKVGGITYKYYKGPVAGTVMNFDGRTADSTGTLNWPLIRQWTADNEFGVRYEGFINIPAAGVYSFKIVSYSQSRLVINNTAVATFTSTNSNDGASGTTTLSAGWQPFLVDMRKTGNTSNVIIAWSRGASGSNRNVVTPSMLSRTSGGVAVAPVDWNRRIHPVNADARGATHVRYTISGRKTAADVQAHTSGLYLARHADGSIIRSALINR